MMPAALRRSSLKLSFALMGVAFVAALTHMLSSTRFVLDAHTSTTRAPEAISRSYSAIKAEEAALRRERKSHSGLALAQSRRVSVSPGTFIHSTEPFAPQLHESFWFATEECRCPQPPDPADLLSSLNILNRQYEAQLPMPMRIAPSPEAKASATSVPRKTQMADLFSEVFVLNLPDRSDRRHYMCTMMQRLGSEALFWPAFSKYNPVVSAYYSDRKFATSDPIKDYMPPGPPPPTGVEQETEATSTKENPEREQPARTEIRLPVISHIEGDSNLTSADAVAANISWGEHPAPRPNKRKMFTRAQAACYVSHREVWHNIVHRQLPRPSLVLEDDVDIELGFPEVVGNAILSLPDDWAVLFVGHCFEEKFSHEDVRIAHRVYKAIKPACTHAYVLRNATVASIMLEELGHDVLKPIDLGLISLIENKGDQIPMYVMLPPPITQLWRTQKRRSWRGGDVANPSDVVVQGLKLPLQRIVTPVKEVVVAEAAAAAELDPTLRKQGEANVTMPLAPFLDWGNMTEQVARGDYLFQGDVSGLLCNNPLFDLKPPEDAPEQLVQYPESEYLP